VPKVFTPTTEEALGAVERGLKAAEQRLQLVVENDPTWDRNEQFWTSYIFREFVLMANAPDNPRNFETTFEAKRSWVEKASQARSKQGPKPADNLHTSARRFDLVVWHPNGRPVALFEIKLNIEKSGLIKDISKLSGALLNLGKEYDGSVKYGILCGRLIVSSRENGSFEDASQRFKETYLACCQEIKTRKVRDFALKGQLTYWHSDHERIAFWAVLFQG
jgi:hypothetical protein